MADTVIFICIEDINFPIKPLFVFYTKLFLGSDFVAGSIMRFSKDIQKTDKIT